MRGSSPCIQLPWLVLQHEWFASNSYAASTRADVVGFEAALHQQGAIWPDDGSLSKLDKRHRGKGLFAIDTVNGDTWKAAEEYCSQTEADLVCVQETKMAAEERINTEATMRAKGWSMSIGDCGSGTKGGKSAGVTVGDLSSHRYVRIDAVRTTGRLQHASVRDEAYWGGSPRWFPPRIALLHVGYWVSSSA